MTTARLAVAVSRALWLAAALSWATASAQARPSTPAWAEPCAAAPRPAQLAPAESLEAWQHNDPLAALNWVCERLRQGDSAFSTQVDLAETLMAASQLAAATRFVDTLEASAATAGPEGQARLELARNALARHRGRMEQASEHAERALVKLAAVATPRPDLQARALLARSAASRALNKPGALALAAASTNAAEEVLVRAGMRKNWRMGDVFNERTMIAYAKDDLAAVVRWAEREVNFIREYSGPDAPGQLDALATLGSATSLRRDSVAALRHLREGQRIGRLAQATRRTAYLGILNNFVPLLTELGRPHEALAVAEEAVALAQTGWGVGSVTTLVPLARRAIALENLSRHVDARRSFAEILAILQREKGQVAMSRRLLLVDAAAGFFSRANDIDTAQQLIDQGLALLPDPQSLPSWRGRLLRRSAMLASAQGEWARAEQLHEEAQPLIAGSLGPKDPLQIATLGLRCTMQLRAALEPKSCLEAAAGVETVTDSSPLHRVIVRLALASHAQQQVRPREHAEHLLQAVAAAQSDRSQGLLWQPLAQLAMQLRSAGRHAEAVALGKAAIERIEAPRAQFAGATSLGAAYLAERQAVYRHLADWLAEDQRVDEAIAVLRLLKGEEYRGFVQSRLNVWPGPAAGLPWTAAERQWLQATPLPAAMQPGPAIDAKVGPLPTLRAIAAQEEAWAAGWRRALQRPLRPGAGGAASPAERAVEPRQALPPDTLVATVFLGPEHINFVLRSSAGQQLVRRSIDSARVVRDVGELLTRLEQRAEVLPLLQSLHQQLAAPIDEFAKRQGARRLLLQLDGDLRYLPYAALHDGQRHLVENYIVAQQVLGHAAARRALPGEAGGKPWLARVQAFGSTRASDNLPALPGVAAEICGIVDGPVDAGPDPSPCPREQRKGAMPGQAWLDAAFTAERLRQATASVHAGQANLLHIGAHFVLRPGEVGRSWLQLGQGRRLQLDELLDWNWGRQDLVTLSACQTAQGGGGEVEGLSNLILSRGAGAVIASLWRVEDRSTADLMRNLYRQMHTGVDPAAALRLAQLEMLGVAVGGSARTHPFHWAGFFLSH